MEDEFEFDISEVDVTMEDILSGDNEEIVKKVRVVHDILLKSLGTDGLLLGDNQVALLILLCKEWLEAYE